MTLAESKAFFTPTSISDVFFYIFLLVAVIAFVNVLIRSKGKWKIGAFSFEPPTDNTAKEEFNKYIASNEKVNESILSEIKNASIDRKILHEKIDGIKDEVGKIKIDSHKLRLESFKTQILLQATNYERKCYLFDEYKKLGGNGWLESEMERFKLMHERGEII